MLNTPISIFPHARSVAPSTATLRDFLRSGSNHLDLITRIRTEQEKEARSELKKQLPAATVSGTFSERNQAGLIAYNGLVCMDFDGDTNPDHTPAQMKAILADFDAVAYAALSVSATGVFCIIPTNLTDHAQHPRVCDFLRTVFMRSGLLADPSCKDITRLRFVSYDPEPYYNPVVEIFDAVRFLADLKEREKRALKPASAADPDDRIRWKVEQYLNAQESGCNDVTEQYNDWMRIGFALASEFGADGENYFHRVSQFHPKYEYTSVSAKYAELLRNGGGSIRIGTFFYIMNQHGIRL